MVKVATFENPAHVVMYGNVTGDFDFIEQSPELSDDMFTVTCPVIPAAASVPT
jgi:hypothetical protein